MKKLVFGGSAIGLVLTVLVLNYSLVAAVKPVNNDQLDVSDRDFRTMAVTPENPEECLAPRPPNDLAPTAYMRNGYRAILRIMAAERWRDTDSCACFLTQITWVEVLARSDEFKTSDDERRPFDVSELRLRADSMLAERKKVCTE